MARDWTRLEVEAVVADYFAMFDAELRGEPYSKTEHRRVLARMLRQRSDSSIEYKHQNISAVLRDMDYPWIPGYKPLSNRQRLLADVVLESIAASHRFDADIEVVAAAPVETAPLIRSGLVLVDPPERPARGVYGRETASLVKPRLRANVDYVGLEARNASLGLAGEQAVLAYERSRLQRIGLRELADQVEHTSVIVGDGAGFDIRSFNEDGSERLIEVKTTSWGKQTPFFVSRNELAVSRERDEAYQLYRVFDFRKRPGLFTAQGPLDSAFALDPIQYVARLA